MVDKKKTFFRDTSLAQIRKKRLVRVPLSQIVDISDDEYIIIDPLFAGNAQSARKFIKHGPEVKLRREKTIQQAIRDKLTPVQMRAEDFNLLNGTFNCAYSFMPLGKDKRKRKVSLRSCLEGARIYAYAHQVEGIGRERPEIIVKPYDKARRVALEGADIIVKMPSRRQKHPRIEFKFTSVPVVDCPEKYAICLNLGSTHSCPLKQYRIRYKFDWQKESSQVVNICAHEVAGFLAIIDHYYNKEKNIVPLQMSQFAVPTQAMVDYYIKLNNNLLIRDNKLVSKHQLRKLRVADIEVGLWSRVKEKRHDATFFPVGSVDGNIRDYKWV